MAPISVELTAEEQAQALWLTNAGKQPLNVQLRVFAWSQADGEDLLAPSGDLVPSSSILTINPGERQLVRLVRMSHEAPARELSYRVLVDELPSMVKGDGGLRFRLRYSIPLFVLPPGATPRFKSGGVPPLTDTASFSARLEERSGKGWLIVRNHGRQRLRLSELSLTASQGKRVTVIAGLVGYVLAGQEKQWQLPVAIQSARMGTLKARLNDDPHQQSLSMVRANP